MPLIVCRTAPATLSLLTICHGKLARVGQGSSTTIQNQYLYNSTISEDLFVKSPALIILPLLKSPKTNNMETWANLLDKYRPH